MRNNGITELSGWCICSVNNCAMDWITQVRCFDAGFFNVFFLYKEVQGVQVSTGTVTRGHIKLGTQILLFL